LSSLLAPSGSGGVAFAAHVGGFVAGILAVRVFLRERRRPRR
jgi:membrane associated rhomboid family serine protease